MEACAHLCEPTLSPHGGTPVREPSEGRSERQHAASECRTGRLRPKSRRELTLHLLLHLHTSPAPRRAVQSWDFFLRPPAPSRRAIVSPVRRRRASMRALQSALRPGRRPHVLRIAAPARARAISSMVACVDAAVAAMMSPPWRRRGHVCRESRRAEALRRCRRQYVETICQSGAIPCVRLRDAV